MNPVMAGIGPDQLISVLQKVDSGDITDYLTAAAELEERDGQYGSTIATRRSAILALELAVTKPSGARQRPYAFVSEWVESGNLRPAIEYLIAALGPGFAATEMVWDPGPKYWLPVFHERDPRQFKFDRETGRELRLDVFGAFDGEPLDPQKWAIHYPHLRPGIPIRSGLARPAMYLHMLKTMSISGMLSLQALFGVPIPVVSYDRSLSTHEYNQAIQALSDVGAGRGTVLPNAAKVEVVQAGSGGQTTVALYTDPLKYIDQQISKLVLGQTMTTDAGSSHAQASVHNDVRKDLRERDAESLSDTINTRIIKPLVDINFGVQSVYPRVKFIIPDDINVSDWTEAVLGFVDRGLPVAASDVHKRLGLREPTANDDLLRRAQ